MKILRTAVCGAILATFASAQATMHDEDLGGLNNTVTIYTKSRTHLDATLLFAAGVTKANTTHDPVFVREKEVWQHGHPGPRILRVILPAKTRHKVRGTTLENDDKIEISLINPNAQGATIGTLILERRISDIPMLTAGHADLAGERSLRACLPRCAVCPSEERFPKSCAEIKDAIVANVKTEDELKASKYVWMFRLETSQDLTWRPKSPVSFDAIQQAVASNFETAVRFDFRLALNGKDGDVLMRDLVVKRGSETRFSTSMPREARFQVCSADETTNVPKCDPLPECSGFWKRHFDKGCRLYGGTGVLTDHDPKKHKYHHHH